jgi:hypothetical protein
VHSPEHSQEVLEARRLGGLRRKREATLTGAYDFEGLDTVKGIRRLIEVAVLDTLALDNGVARNRTLAYLAMVALRTHELGDLEDRIMALEQAVHGKREYTPPVFDSELPLIESPGREEEP